MANADRPAGLKPFGGLISCNEYEAGSAIAVGDVVVMADDGQIDPVAIGGSSYTGASCGVAMSVASGAGVKVLVADSPDQQFETQADGSDVDAQTDINLNYAVLGTTAAGGESKMELDSSTGATTATLPLKLLRISKVEGNALGAQVKCIVKINNHQLSGGTGSAGI